MFSFGITYLFIELMCDIVICIVIWILATLHSPVTQKFWLRYLIDTNLGQVFSNSFQYWQFSISMLLTPFNQLVKAVKQLYNINQTAHDCMMSFTLQLQGNTVDTKTLHTFTSCEIRLEINSFQAYQIYPVKVKLRIFGCSFLAAC